MYTLCIRVCYCVSFLCCAVCFLCSMIFFLFFNILCYIFYIIQLNHLLTQHTSFFPAHRVITSVFQGWFLQLSFNPNVTDLLCFVSDHNCVFLLSSKVKTVRLNQDGFSCMLFNSSLSSHADNERQAVRGWQVSLRCHLRSYTVVPWKEMKKENGL